MAASAEMRAALPDLLAALNADPAVRVVVMTGAGDKAFVSGADIPLTVAAAKAAIREAARPAERRDLARVDVMVEACFRSADYLEGQRAFAEKRPPAFTGR